VPATAAPKEKATTHLYNMDRRRRGEHPYVVAWEHNKSLIGTKNAQGVDTVKTMVDAMAQSKTGTAEVASYVARAVDVDPNAKLYLKSAIPRDRADWNWMVVRACTWDDLDEQLRSAPTHCWDLPRRARRHRHAGRPRHAQRAAPVGR